MNLKRVLTDHAIARYRSRINADATRDEIEKALREGDWRPGHFLTLSEPTDGVVLVNGGFFPMREHEGRLVATTCIRIRRRPKAERRAWREQQREDELLWMGHGA